MRREDLNLFVPVIATTLLAGCATVSAQPQAAPVRPAPATQPVAAVPAEVDGPAVDATLDKLDALGRNLTDFTADAELTEIDGMSGNSTTRLGTVRYQARPDGNARIRVTFTKKDEDEKLYDEKIEYVLQDGVLIDRNYNTRSEVRRQVLKPGEKVNLLKLGEGPFPLPIGQEKAEVHRLFEVTPIAAAPGDPANTTHLRLVPRPDTQFSGQFTAIDVWVDDTSSFPVRIDAEDANKTSIRKTVFKNVKTNTGLTDADFTLEAVEGWNVQTGEFQP
jgi:outer membrane lipoprotein-sorting protein